MRAPLFLFATILLAASAFAQEQDRKLYDRIMKPDMGQSFNLDKAAGGSSRSFGTKQATSKGFGFEQKFRTKDYNAKDFNGTKTAWMGDFKFGTKGAPTRGKYEIQNASKQVDTKASPVKDATESNKEMATREFADQKEFRKRGKSQDRLDAEGGVPKDGKPVGWSGDMKPMTIDDVRDLLNKSK